MSEYKLTDKEEKEIKTINDVFEQAQDLNIYISHNNASSFNEEKYIKNSKNSSSLIIDMWNNMNHISKKEQ